MKIPDGKSPDIQFSATEAIEYQQIFMFHKVKENLVSVLKNVKL